MSRNNEILRPPSLAQHFDAPDDYRGHFAWLCGYSADAMFLDNAAERFTRLTRSQRAHQGRIALAAFLDPGNSPISLLDAPGVAHLPIVNNAKKPFALLHAKVALLGFRHQEDHSQWKLRLLVSTGNWTRQTLEESLDLVWRIDVSSESLLKPEEDVQQNCADMKAAWQLMEWIGELFDNRLLNAGAQGQVSETIKVQQEVMEWINACSKKARGQARVFDNWKKSLLSQLSEKIKAGSDVKRNYLAMGSGFYETSEDSQMPPKVPLGIVQTLSKEGLLTGKPTVDLYVNPDSCQAIATALKPLQDHGIRVRPASVPAFVFGQGKQRSLHAKFLFSANTRENSNTCTSAWVYIGSGNLTHPGFANKMSPTAGNLEAGVVFAPHSLSWEKDKENKACQVVTNLLPIQWDKEIKEATALKTGSDMEQRNEVYVAAPIAWLVWHEANGVRELRSDKQPLADVDVLDSVSNACAKAQSGFQWRDARPLEVCIRWKVGDQVLKGQIPVVDQFGRIAATELPLIDIDEAWWQLAEFPMPPSHDEDGSEGGDENEGKKSNKGRSAPITSYPIRQMMELIESIAAKQTEINERDWALWCNRIEQTLEQAKESAPVKYFRDELKLNPLSPLRHQSFRPSFAENTDSELGKLYDDTVSRIEACWQVDLLTPIETSK